MRHSSTQFLIGSSWANKAGAAVVIPPPDIPPDNPPGGGGTALAPNAAYDA